MTKELSFQDRVVVITGAGNGLGQEYARLFASRGAKVVVNDLGGGPAGDENSSYSAADKTVAMIKQTGGDAVANYDSVEDGEKIVQTAMDCFGGVDVIVNNAGILRDRSFIKLEEKDWDLLYRVHLLGAYRVTKAAWGYLREKEYGRIIFTSSAAGIYGNFGQANYGAMKMGLYGLAQTLAVEGVKKNILVNTIAPAAASRLTKEVLPEPFFENLKPSAVSPLVAYLAHESNRETGGLYELGGGWIGKLRWERTHGTFFQSGEQFTVEDVEAKMPEISDFGNSHNPVDMGESFSPIAKSIGAIKQ